MKKLLLFILVFAFTRVPAQVTITQDDMPHSGDSLYRTRAFLNPFLNYAATGPNHVWNFDNLSADVQDSAIYQTVSSTNFVYALTFIDLTLNPNRANHAKPGTDIPFNNLLPITNPYTFYYRSATVYKTVGFGVELTGIPVPIVFTSHDEIYQLPIDFGNTDSTFSSYNISIPSLAYYGYEQSRMNEVDGWGTITTPTGTFDALRVKTTLLGRDTINIDSLGIGFAIDRPVVREYKWLSPMYRIPIMQVNTSEIFGIEIITDIFFYDLPRSITVVPPLANVLCLGQTVTINYAATGVFNTGGIFIPANDFIAQLSDSNGDFTNAVDIGSVTLTQSGTITCTIPANTPVGYGYRIRVVSTSPAFTGPDNGYDLLIGTEPVAAITASGNTEICDGEFVVLSTVVNSSYSYQWQLNGVDLTASIFSDLIATDSGSYTVVVTNACGTTTSAPVDVIVHELPEHIFSQTSYAVCDSTQLTITAVNSSGQSPLTYQWYLDGNLLPGETTDSISGYLEGNYSLEIINPATGCMFTANVSVTVDSLVTPIVNVQGSSSICQGDSVLLNVVPEPGINYQWMLNNSPITGATGTDLYVNASGIYSVMATSVNGCSTVSDPGINVTVNPAPQQPVINATTTVICEGDSLVLDFIAVIGFTYQWTLNGTAIPGEIFNQITVTNNSGTYSVIVTDMTGCTAEASNPVLVTVNPLPALPVVTQSNDTLYASGSGNFQWYLNGTLIPGATGSFYIPLVNGDYTVTVSDSNSCLNTSVIYTMTNVGIFEYHGISVTVNPNPSTGYFSLYNSSSEMEYLITDVTGKLLMSGKMNIGWNKLDLTPMSDGIYLLQLYATNHPVSVVKLVKE